MTPGIVWAATSIKNPKILPEATFNTWYNEMNHNNVLNSGVPDFAIRCKNLASEHPFQYTTIYNIPDLSGLYKKEFQDIPITSDLLGGNNDWRNELLSDMRVYELVQVLEGPYSQDAGRNKGIVTVFVDIAKGMDDQFDEWYRKQHLDMASMCRGFIRSTWCRLDGDNYVNTTNPKGSVPAYGTIYEYDTTNFPNDQLKIVSSTEWSKKMIPCLTRVERDTWANVTDQATKAAKGNIPRLGVV